MTGRVVWVVDGDTIHVRVGPRLEKVRYIEQESSGAEPVTTRINTGVSPLSPVSAREAYGKLDFARRSGGPSPGGLSGEVALTQSSKLAACMRGRDPTELDFAL